MPVVFQFAVSMVVAYGLAAMAARGGMHRVRQASRVTLAMHVLLVGPAYSYFLLRHTAWTLGFFAPPAWVGLLPMGLLVLFTLSGAVSGAIGAERWVELGMTGRLNAMIAFYTGMLAACGALFGKAFLFGGSYEEWHAGAKDTAFLEIARHYNIWHEPVGRDVRAYVIVWAVLTLAACVWLRRRGD
jgi:hypothetical protein